MGFLTGNTDLYDRLTLNERVKYFADLNGVDRSTFEHRCDELFTTLDMHEFADRRIGKLSSGMKQKISIVRTIIHDPEVIVFDEPTVGLDVVTSRIIVQLIRDCKEDGETVIFSTHRMGEVSLQIQDLIQAGSLDSTILFAEDFDRKVADLQTGTIKLYFKSSEDLNIARRRLKDLLEDLEKGLLSDRFKKLYLDENVAEMIDFEMNDVTSAKEKLGKTIGGLLPYILCPLLFYGQHVPCHRHLGAGEKERGTLETLLVSPANRLQILLGKFGVIILTGILSAAVAVLGLFVAVQQAKTIPSELLNAIYGIFEVQSILLILSLRLLLTVFFAAGLLSLSIFAKSFKETQSLISPLSFIVIVPVFIGMLPGITLNTTTALIPVLNVSLATKEIISGTIAPGLLAEEYASLFLLAALSLCGCSRWFEREGTMFRSS